MIKIKTLGLLLCLAGYTFNVSAVDITQPQKANLYKLKEVSGIRVNKKSECTSQEFVDELQAKKDLVGFIYSVDYIADDQLFAIVNNYGQNVPLVYGDPSTQGPWPATNFNGWGYAARELRAIKTDYFDIQKIGQQDLLNPLPIPAPSLTPYTTNGSIVERFRTAFVDNIKETFDNRMDCVKFNKIWYNQEKKQLEPNDNYLTHNSNIGEVSDKYPMYATPSPINVAVIDTQISQWLEFEQHEGSIKILPENFSGSFINNSGVSVYLDPRDTMTRVYGHGDVMNSIIVREQPSHSKIYVVQQLRRDTGACAGGDCYKGLEMLYNRGIAENDIRVINMSFNDEEIGNSAKEQAYINQIVSEKDVAVVQSVGNSPWTLLGSERGRNYATSLEITVGTIRDGIYIGPISNDIADLVVPDTYEYNLKIPGWSNPTEEYPDGQRVVKSYLMWPDPQYTEKYGPGESSIAAAQVSGFVAYMRGIFPWLTVPQIKEALCASADPVPLYISPGNAGLEAYARAINAKAVRCGVYNPLAAMDYAYDNWGTNGTYPAIPYSYLYKTSDAISTINIVYRYYVRTDGGFDRYYDYTTSNKTVQQIAEEKKSSLEYLNNYYIQQNPELLPSTYTITGVVEGDLNVPGYYTMVYFNPNNNSTSQQTFQIYNSKNGYPYVQYGEFDQLLSFANTNVDSIYHKGKSITKSPAWTPDYWSVIITALYPDTNNIMQPPYTTTWGPVSYKCYNNTAVQTINGVKTCTKNVVRNYN